MSCNGPPKTTNILQRAIDGYTQQTVQQGLLKMANMNADYDR